MASTYLTRTLGSGDTQKWTISFWTKKMMASGALLSVGTSGNYDQIYFNADKFAYYSATGGADDFFIYSQQVFRDSSAWYHIVLAIDTTQATSSNRAKLYVNGEQVTTFDGSNVYPSLNFNGRINSSSQHNIGNRIYSSDFNFNGSMAHVHFIDGTVYDASAFGQTDTATGIWKPKTAPDVTYGTNGFFLKFENSAAFGTDSSGNANNFTVNGTMTQTIDTPSNVFATLNPLCKGSNIVLSNGNNSYSTHDAWEATPSTLAFSKGKWYAEFKPTSVLGAGNSFIMFGIDSTALTSTWINQYSGFSSEGYGYGWDGEKRNNANNTSYGNSFSQNDIIGVAVDMDNNYLYFSKNGVFQNSGVPTSGATGTGGLALTGTEYYFIGSGYNNGVNATFQTNFGNGYFGTTAVSSAQSPSDGIGIFEYEVPSGYKALCTKSINAQEYS